jgi:hypothetical protein
MDRVELAGFGMVLAGQAKKFCVGFSVFGALDAFPGAVTNKKFKSINVQDIFPTSFPVQSWQNVC